MEISDEFDANDEVEEGEFLAPDVADWKSDDEIIPDADADVSEHVVFK